MDFRLRILDLRNWLGRRFCIHSAGTGGLAGGDAGASRRGRGRGAAGDFEDPVRFFNEELKILVGKVAVGVELFEFGGFGFGGGVVIHLQGQEGFAQASEGVEHAEVGGRVGLKAIFVRAGSNVVDLLGELSDGELEPDKGESRSIVLAGELEQVILRKTQLVPAVAGLEFLLIAAVIPVREVLEIKSDTLLGQFARDSFIDDAIVEELVDEVTLCFGEVSDFAIAPGRRGLRQLRGVGRGTKVGR